jgi:hypothetical protein
MARRRSPVVNFLEGFNAGWDTVGKVGSAFEVSRLEDEEERIREATKKGGKGLQADADGNYSVFGMSFDTKPTEFDISYARNTRQADIYDRYGQKDFARSLRADAKNDRIQGQQYAFNQEYNPLRLEDARAGIASKRASTEATSIANKFNRDTYATRKAQVEANLRLAEANIITAEEAEKRNQALFPGQLEAQRLNNVGLGITNAMNESRRRVQENTEDTQIQQAQTNAALGQENLESAQRTNAMGEAVFDSSVAAQVAQNNEVLKRLPAETQSIITNADRDALALQFEQQTFDTRADALQTSLDISKQQLDTMIKSDPLKLQGMMDANILNAMQIDEKRLDKTQKEQIFQINQAYRDALVDGDFSGVEKNIMPFAAQVYNDNRVTDDNYTAQQDAEGNWVIVGADGEVVGNASDILGSADMAQKRDFIRQAQSYAVAAITGNYGAIDELYKTDAWIDYYQAQAAASRRGKSLTKEQWAIGRLNENPADRLALAMLLPTGTYEALDFSDPEAVAQQLGLNSGGISQDLQSRNGNPDGQPTSDEPPATPPGMVLLQSIQNSGGIIGSRPSLTEYAASLATPPNATGIAGRNNSRNAAANAQTLSALNNPAVLDEAIRYQQLQIEALQTNQPSGNARRGAQTALTKAQQLLEELIAYRQSLGQTTR